MKLFQSLLVAPAVLGFLSPLTANATELNLEDFSRYSNNNVENISNFSELYPSDWSYQAIKQVVTSRNCPNLIPSGTISRFEAAVIINTCLKNFAQITEQERRLIDEFNAEISLIKSSVNDSEVSFDGFEAGSFSSTTVASFSADFAIGAVDGKTVTKSGGTTTVTILHGGADGKIGGGNAADDVTINNVVQKLADVTEKAEALSFDYGYEIGLATSFTGEDSLDVALVAGVGQLSEFDLNQDNGSTVVVDGISYTFPVGESTTAFISHGVEGSALFNTACVYEGPSDTLSSCGNVSSAIDEDGQTIGAGASFDFDNGFTASIGYEGQGDTTAGLSTKEGLDSIAGQLAYTADNYGFSLTSARIETSETNHDTFTAVNAFFSPEEGAFPSISVGYEWGDVGGAAATADETSSYFVGLQWDELGEGSFGISAGTHTPVIEDGDELMMYEVWYSYPINDGMTITPLIYTKDMATGTDDQTGIMVKTSFSF